MIAREEMHVSWVRDAILDASGQTNEAAGGVAEDATEPVIQVSGKGVEAQARPHGSGPRWGSGVRRQVAAAGRVAHHARHRTMLNVILGETLEHKRFFEQAVAGRTDLLGRRLKAPEPAEECCPSRWIEQ